MDSQDIFDQLASYISVFQDKGPEFSGGDHSQEETAPACSGDGSSSLAERPIFVGEFDVEDAEAVLDPESTSLRSEASNTSEDKGIDSLSIDAKREALQKLEKHLSVVKRGRPSQSRKDAEQLAKRLRAEIEEADESVLAPNRDQDGNLRCAGQRNLWKEVQQLRVPRSNETQIQAYSCPATYTAVSAAFDKLKSMDLSRIRKCEITMLVHDKLLAVSHTTPKITHFCNEHGIRREKLISSLRMLGEGIKQLGRKDRAEIEDYVARNLARTSKLQYLEHARYDETPLWLVQLLALNGFEFGDSGEPDDDRCHALVLPSAMKHYRIPAAPVKMVVTRSGYSMLVKLEGKYVVIEGRATNSIRSVKACTTSAMAKLQLELSGATSAADTFPEKRKKRLHRQSSFQFVRRTPC